MHGVADVVEIAVGEHYELEVARLASLGVQALVDASALAAHPGIDENEAEVGADEVRVDAEGTRSELELGDRLAHRNSAGVVKNGIGTLSENET